MSGEPSIQLAELEGEAVRPGCHVCTDFTAVEADVSAGAVGSPGRLHDTHHRNDIGGVSSTARSGGANSRPAATSTSRYHQALAAKKARAATGTISFIREFRNVKTGMPRGYPVLCAACSAVIPNTRGDDRDIQVSHPPPAPCRCRNPSLRRQEDGISSTELISSQTITQQDTFPGQNGREYSQSRPG